MLALHLGLVWCLVSFTAISSDFFREGAVAFALYFQFSDEIGTDQRALILLSVLARHRALRRMAGGSALLGICFLRNGFQGLEILKQARISELVLWMQNVLYSHLLFPARCKADSGRAISAF